MLNKKELEFLKKLAKEVRKDIIRMAFEAQSAHAGGALSCVELLVALYFKIMRVNPKLPYAKDRDRLFFSKAHDAKALYAVLAERGYFNKKILDGYEKNGGKLPGHSTRNCVPGVEISAGSLGHGLPMAVGSAFVGRLDNKNYRVFAVISDGECDEGSTWEAILFAGHHKLDNLVVVVDYNKLQGFGFTKEVLNLEPFVDKWRDFGWEVKRTNGHNISGIIGSLTKLPFKRNKPSVLILDTIKGYGGVKRHINKVSSQYKPPTEDEFKELIKI
jgi:transketolase